MVDDELTTLLAEQVAYYRARAPEYLDGALHAPGGDELKAALDAFAPRGEVLKLACGPGSWTPRLLHYAASVTAVDASPEMLALAHERAADRTRHRASQCPEQPVDRDHHDILLKSLHTTCANQADDRDRAAPTPVPAPARKPCRLIAHLGEMPIVVRPRLDLDRERDARRRDRERVDVPTPPPAQRVPEPPPLRLKRREGSPNLVLRASTNAAALGEREPVASVEPQPEREHEQGSRG
jgi:hypothetical protein